MHADATDYYELLQISPNADPDTVTRVFRLLARRYHPDQPDTGNEEKFREILAAYAVLSDPEKRARYDVNHVAIRRERWRFVSEGAPDAGDYAAEHQVRLVMLEILYARRRTEPHKPGLSLLDLAELMGQPLEHLEFSSWYLVQKKFVLRNDQSQSADHGRWCRPPRGAAATRAHRACNSPSAPLRARRPERGLWPACIIEARQSSRRSLAEGRKSAAGGKSELRRAVRRVTPGRGNPTESGTENIPLGAARRAE